MIAGAVLVALAVGLWRLSIPETEAGDDATVQDFEVLGQVSSESRADGRAVIDAHSHLFSVDAWPNILAVMESQGIAYFINLSGGSPRQGMTRSLELSEASGGRILNCMTINWDGFGESTFGEVVAAELEIAVTRYGYACLKVSKALGLYVVDIDDSFVPVDDPRLFPIWERAGELGVPVIIHTSDPRAFWEPISPDNERYAELLAHPSWSFAAPEYFPRDTLLAQRDHLLELFPETTFVGVHFGNNPEDIAYVDRLLQQYPNLYVDVAARVPEIGRHDPEVVRDLFLRHQDRILFGTDIAIGRSRRGVDLLTLGSSGAEPDTVDRIPFFFDAHWRFFETEDRAFPHPTPIQGDWTIDGIGLPPEVLSKIYYQNTFDLVIGPALARAID